jgi:deoxyribonuclease V
LARARFGVGPLSLTTTPNVNRLGKTAAHTGLVWPSDPAELMRAQRELAVLSPPGWQASAPRPVGACYVCFARGEVDWGGAGERGWAAAVLMRGNRGLGESAVVVGAACAPYEPGLLALREGPLLEPRSGHSASNRRCCSANASGRDHPCAAGLALHLGAVLGPPSIGVTDRPLLAEGREPGAERGATSAALVSGVEAARLLSNACPRPPVVVPPGWRTDLDRATAVVLASTRRARTPEPLRDARTLARYARAAATPDPHA